MKFAQGLLCALVVSAACKGSSRDSDSPVPGVERSESELKKYVAWQHDWMALALRQKTERQTETQKLNGQIAPGTNGTAQESALGELTTRQQDQMSRFMATAPTGPTATALRLTLAGIGAITGNARGMTYTPRHDDAQLNRARTYYGDKFVSWVLTHEGEINATLGADR